MSRKKTTEEFITDARNKHGNLYDYSLVKYDGKTKKVKIICCVHGEFEQTAADHLAGYGCNKCGREKIKKALISSTEKFVSKARAVHGGKFSYTKTKYENAKTKVIITCPFHGDFTQTPNDHLNGCGCRHCRTESVGWEDSKWELQGVKSKNFLSFRLYIVKIWNDNEVFYKVGKTFVPYPNRFSDIIKHYKYELVYDIIGSAKEVCELERAYQRSNKEFKYNPKVNFCGHTECFSKIAIADKGILI